MAKWLQSEKFGEIFLSDFVEKKLTSFSVFLSREEFLLEKIITKKSKKKQVQNCWSFDNQFFEEEDDEIEDHIFLPRRNRWEAHVFCILNRKQQT